MRTTHLFILGILSGVLVIPSTCPADTLVFSSGFEYAGSNPVVGTDAANLNGAIGQVGTFSGTIPASPTSGSNGGGAHAPELIDFLGNPNGGQGIWVDRPEVDGTFSANLSAPIKVNGATIAIDLATRRTGTGTVKDYDVVGFDGDGNESFHIRIDTDNATTGRRLKVVTDNGSTVTSDLDTTSGTDAGGDIPNWAASGATLDANELASLALNLTDTGYTIEFDRDTISYVTDLIDFNGAASTLARIEFQFHGGDDNNNSGFFIDNLAVTGITAVPEPASIALWSLLGLAAVGFVVWQRRR